MTSHSRKQKAVARGDLFNRVVLALNDAVLDDARWPAAASLLEQVCGSTGNELVVGEGDGNDVRIHFERFYHRGERREDLERAYFEVYHQWDERIPRLRQLPDSRVTPVRELYTEHELKTSPAYNEALKNAGAQNGLNVRMDAADGERIVWALGDSLEASGWGTWQIDTIQRLAPHLRHFVMTRQALATARALNDSFEELLDSTRLAIVHLDRRAHITAANEPARAILSRADGLYEEDGFLRSRLPADDDQLQALLANALPRFGGTAVGGSMTVRRAPTLPRLAVHLSPVSPRQMDFGAWRAGALVIIIEPKGKLEIDEKVVASTLGLTPAESRVAVSLATGQTVRDIAQQLGRKEDSIRSHVKHIFNKQGISRQPDLVRLVLLATDPAATALFPAD